MVSQPPLACADEVIERCLLMARSRFRNAIDQCPARRLSPKAEEANVRGPVVVPVPFLFGRAVAARLVDAGSLSGDGDPRGQPSGARLTAYAWWYGRSDRARRLHRPGKMTLRRVNAMVQKRHWSSVSAYPLCAYCTQLEPRRVSSECPPLVMPLSQSCKEKLQLQPSSAALLLPSEGGRQPEKKPLHL